METVFLILKTVLVLLVIFGVGDIGFAPMTSGGDFPPSQLSKPGDRGKYLQLDDEDAGVDTFNPTFFAAAITTVPP